MKKPTMSSPLVDLDPPSPRIVTSTLRTWFPFSFSNFPTRLLARFFERFEEALSILAILEEGTALIAARHDVVHRSRVLDAQGSGHSPCRMDDPLERLKPKLSQFDSAEKGVLIKKRHLKTPSKCLHRKSKSFVRDL